MVLTLPESEQQLLRQAQRACRGKAGYVTVLLLLDKGRPVPVIADDLELSHGVPLRPDLHEQDLTGYLRAEQPGYWGLFTSAQLAGLCRELNHMRYFDCRAIADWLADTTGVHYSVSGLTELLHRLGYAYKLTTAVPCKADTTRQIVFVVEQLRRLLAAAETGKAVVYFADAAHLTHNIHPSYMWTQAGQERPLLTVSGRHRMNLNAALNAHCPTQVHLDETECVDAQSTPRLYEKLLATHPDGPVYIICNDARYCKNKALTEWLADKRLV